MAGMATIPGHVVALSSAGWWKVVVMVVHALDHDLFLL